MKFVQTTQKLELISLKTENVDGVGLKRIEQKSKLSIIY